MGMKNFCVESSSSAVSSSSETGWPTCDALIPECGYTPEALCAMGNTEYCAPVDPNNPLAIANAPVTARVSLERQGNMLVSDRSITLFDVTGHIVKAVSGSGRTVLSLENMRQGVYIAKSGSNVLKVNVK